MGFKRDTREDVLYQAIMQCNTRTTRCFPALYNDSQKLSLRLRLCVFNKSEFHRLRQAIIKPKPL